MTWPPRDASWAWRGWRPGRWCARAIMPANKARPSAEMSAWSYARRTLLNPRSRACFWKHPAQAARMVSGALGNDLLSLGDRLPGSSRRECPVCRWQGRRFRTFVSPEIVIPSSICPRCGSFERHRHLVLGMREELARTRAVPERLLGVSLSPAMSYLVAQEGLGRCFRTDYDRRDPRIPADAVADLRAAGFRDGAFAWIVCSHVLEHVPEVEAAIDELHRVLAPGGVLWLQVAWHDELAASERIPVDPGALDAHAWRFGRDFPARLARPGWSVTGVFATELDPEVRSRHGIHPDERYWIVRRACDGE
ncbi:methyltransferase domain-containing protein [bacterium]|nr:methyltransferase domain-containing protein [bacterium]